MSVRSHYDLVIIGAGPAGLAAAIEASRHDLSTLVLDDQPTPGGQVYRNITQNKGQRHASAFLGNDYWSGSKLVDGFAHVSAEVLSESRVWQITSDRQVFFSRRGIAKNVQAGAVLVATGVGLASLLIVHFSLDFLFERSILISLYNFLRWMSRLRQR